ncbi:Eco57I restriction-modification methylase domain-containing protein [Bacteroides pyogenes]|nr:Eco57I restriction-modification methylase domain-containing protein [Bacteroides pyogenes]MBB3894797.1 adenine-specific DNA-methyltransferase [Bacteroides pyogenes]SUV35241.1 Modification methylase VspI [Bacteroides pyogenes]
MNISWSEIKPYQDELPTHYADRIGKLYADTVSATFKKSNGQFFTPISIGHFMSKQIDCDKDSITILDPGCGTALLSCAAIESLVLQSKVKRIELVAYETDENLMPALQRVLEYLTTWGERHNVRIDCHSSCKDFILSNYSVLYADTIYEKVDNLQKFDLIISNPPYFKLSKEDKRAKAAQRIIDGQPNIYSIFMAVSALLLTEQGQMIYITPRSFTSGRYFRLFRNFLFEHVQIDFIHLFNTRKDTFSKDNVLQETLIMKCSPKKETDYNIILSYSEGLFDLAASVIRTVRQKEIIDLTSKEQILHLPVNLRDEKIIKLFKSWNGNLNKYHIQISTGPVVAFRSKEQLCDTAEEETTSLYWLHNVVKMLADHPVVKEGKPQFIRINASSVSTLLPNKNYVLLRRFSSKDDSSRLIAAPYFGNMTSCGYVGIENKLNYIYRPKGHLNRMEVMGIAALLNSDLFDNYFRTFNGNVNVSATELREMPMPPLEVIKSIGKDLIATNDYSMVNVNKIVNKYFM